MGAATEAVERGTVESQSVSWKLVLPMLLLLALGVVAPMMLRGSADGHDLPYHVQSWIDVSHQWRHGVWFPRWASLAAYGFGDPAFVFYPPASRTIGAALISLVPTDAAAGTYIFFVLVMAGASMFVLARRWLSPAHAVVAAAFYMVNPYMLLCVYQRAAFAEVLAGALFPLVLHFALLLPQRTAIVPLAVTFAACWLSDLPAAVVVTYVLALLLPLYALTNRSLRVLLFGAAAMALGFALDAFFLVPAAYEQRWVDIQQAISPDFRPESWEFTWNWDAEAHWFYAVVSGIVWSESILGAVASVLSWRWRRAHSATWWALTALVVVPGFMMTPWAGPVWTHLPELEFVQFPWRTLFVLSTSLALLMVAVFSRWKWQWAAGLMLMLALAGGVVSGWTAPWHRHAVTDVLREVRQNSGYEGDPQFLPPSVQYEQLMKHRASIPAVSADQETQLRDLRWSPAEKTFAVDTPRPTVVTLRLIAYPGWQARMDGQDLPVSSDSRGLLQIRVPSGRHEIEVAFTRTPDRTIGNALSLVALLAMAALLWQIRTSNTRAPREIQPA